jgi:drug/metabolite transporter (DMT)-like permease
LTAGVLIGLCVLGRIATASWSNVAQKRALAGLHWTPWPLLVTTWGVMTFLAAPWWIAAVGLEPGFWYWMLAACALEAPGNWLLLRSLRCTDLSVYGPLNSFKPAVSLGLAALLFGEWPSATGVAGVAIVLLGTVWLTSESPPGGRPDEAKLQHRSLAYFRAWMHSGVRDRISAVVLTAAASVCLKPALDYGSPWQVLGAWCLLGFLLPMAAWGSYQLLRRVGDTRDVTASSERITTTGSPVRERTAGLLQIAVATLTMQAFTIALFARMPVGYALALFQLGSLISVYLGHRLFGEPHLLRRLLAAGVMVAGAAVIILAA